MLASFDYKKRTKKYSPKLKSLDLITGCKTEKMTYTVYFCSLLMLIWVLFRTSRRVRDSWARWQARLASPLRRTCQSCACRRCGSLGARWAVSCGADRPWPSRRPWTTCGSWCPRSRSSWRRDASCGRSRAASLWGPWPRRWCSAATRSCPLGSSDRSGRDSRRRKADSRPASRKSGYLYKNKFKQLSQFIYAY